MKSSYRIARMVGQFEQRKNQLDRGRIDERVAPFFAGRNSQAPQQVNQSGDGRVRADKDADGRRWRGQRAIANALRRVLERFLRLVFVFTGGGRYAERD